ncbi:exocyst subunit [Maudiozyma humilis]|uniref:Exocyst complex component EXO84 n=1 Tax=Maudiozyma humilis TaxID=51915 RepID=A0AAV5S1Q6_MAUHU|nr:exocyst subunit [Kazachstania humilis]
MVEISLRKARNNWKNVTGSPSKNKAALTGGAPGDKDKDRKKKAKKAKDKGKAPKANPYSQLDSSYAPLPTINAREKNKAASSMQRRLSMHTQNYVPPTLDYSMPLPMSSLGQEYNNSTGDVSAIAAAAAAATKGALPDSSQFYRGGPNSTMSRELAKMGDTRAPRSAQPSAPAVQPISDLLQTSVLRSLLSDTHFNTKQFVRERLGNASASDIDAFTTALTSLSDRVQSDVKQNLNKSYNEIIQVNDGLFVASNELKTLRENFKQLMEVITEFDNAARERLTIEQESEAQRKSAAGSGLLPPAGTAQKQRRDRSSIMVLDKIWREELVNLIDTVDGSKNVVFEGGQRNANRHIVMKSAEWVELNSTTLRFLQMVRFYILNDMIIVATRNKTNDLVLNQCLDLKTINVSKQPNVNRILFKPDTMGGDPATIASNKNISNGLLYETRDEKECMDVLEAIRKAKDSLSDIFETEVEHERKIKESFKYLQSAQQTPSTDKYNSRSPAKSNRRSIGVSMTPKRNSRHASGVNGVIGMPGGNSLAAGVAANPSGVSAIVNSFMDQNLLQSLSLSMHTSQLGNDNSSVPAQLKSLDDQIEEVDVQIARLKFDAAVQSLSMIEDKINSLYQHSYLQKNGRESSPDENDSGDFTMLYNLLMLKITQRRDTIAGKLSQSILADSEIARLLTNVQILVKLGQKEQSLDLFLQNRATTIQNLTLQIGSFDNPVNYLTQLAVIRFQTIKQTILNFQRIFVKSGENEISDKKFSSILVNWCSEEVDKHFQMIDKQLLNNEMLSPASIKSTRKQIDDLKTVGLDFVYKLDDFIRKNKEMIR